MGTTDSYEIREKVGIIGLGSIGVRHCEALSKLGIHKILALRTGKGNKIIPSDIINIVENVQQLNDLKEADYFIIANPTSLHINALKELILFNKPIFIEKPLSDNISSVDKELIEIIASSNQKIQIGFCLRYHPVIMRVKEILDSGILGTIYYSEIKVGQYLPQWHSYTDYRNEYFSRKSLGGGALRTLSHEIDLAQFFFGKPQSVKAILEKVSDLEIDVDDLAVLFLKNNRNITKIEIDFLQRKPIRIGKILGSKYDLHYDIFGNNISLYDDLGNCVDHEELPKDDMYFLQMKSFINKKEDNFATFDESLIQMRIIEIAEKYGQQNNWIEI